MITFQFKCGFMGRTFLMVYGDGASYEISIRHGQPSEYELSISNGDDVRAQILSEPGILRREHPIKIGAAHSWLVSQEVLDAYNASVLAQHDAWITKMLANPDKYGEPTADDLRLPLVAIRAEYDMVSHTFQPVTTQAVAA